MQKRMLAMLMLCALLVGLTAGSAMADAVSPSETIEVEAGKSFSVEFTYTYTGAPIRSSDSLVCSIDSSAPISVSVSGGNTFGYINALQVTSKTVDILGNTYDHYDGKGTITITISGKAPSKGDTLDIRFTPKGQPTLPKIEIEGVNKK